MGEESGKRKKGIWGYSIVLGRLMEVVDLIFAFKHLCHHFGVGSGRILSDNPHAISKVHLLNAESNREKELLCSWVKVPQIK